ncbi:MAG: hypothetical protein P8K80_00795, partial [Phycisphaerales bacterium]|nr:hypothetical protein [Phycisphaerales bacterium]
MFDRRLFIILTALTVSMPAIAGDAGWSTQPTIHGDHIVFVSEGDLFSAQVHGGTDPITAHRLTTHAGSESRPHLSPDGRWIAFTGGYGGSPDVHVMPAEGGSPVQLTFHPGDDLVVGWSPDGTHVYFASRRSHPLYGRELWSVPVDGGMPEPA